MVRRSVFIALVVAVAGGLWLLVSRTPPNTSSASVDLGPTPDTSGFARATTPRAFQFPLDHGPHFDYQTEWWYYTGTLESDAGQRFGYELTFFRHGLTPGAPPAGPGLATNQIYFAHFAVTDAAANTHVFAERFSRGAGGLAGASGSRASGPRASGQPFGAWLEDWMVESLDPDGSAVHLVARDGDRALDLELHARKPIVAHGDRGLSVKGEEPGSASYYLSFTRMGTTGTLMLGNTRAVVRGESWFDHEWSTSAMGPQIVGWDWFSVQLSDGRELMLGQIRRKDGRLESAFSGTIVAPDGGTRHLSGAEMQITVDSHWRSPKTNADYPARWRIVVPSEQMDLTAEPWVADQEMRVSPPYWEGAVDYTGTSHGEHVTGRGYIELTGYAQSMQEIF